MPTKRKFFSYTDRELAETYVSLKLGVIKPEAGNKLHYEALEFAKRAINRKLIKEIIANKQKDTQE